MASLQELTSGRPFPSLVAQQAMCSIVCLFLCYQRPTRRTWSYVHHKKPTGSRENPGVQPISCHGCRALSRDCEVGEGVPGDGGAARYAPTREDRLSVLRPHRDLERNAGGVFSS